MSFGNELSGTSTVSLDCKTSPRSKHPIPSLTEEAPLLISERGKNYFGNWPNSLRVSAEIRTRFITGNGSKLPPSTLQDLTS